MSLSSNEIRFLEELALTAWPALQAVYDDGWVLRFADGYTRRANSTNPLYPSLGDLGAKITRCEAFYSARGLNTVVKLTPASRELDDPLAQRGYIADAPVSIQTLDLSRVTFDELEAGTLADHLTDDWLGAFTRLDQIDPCYMSAMQTMLTSIAPLTCFSSIRREGEIIAVGLGVLDRGYVGLFDIVTDARWRGQGLGRQTVLNLLRWGVERGAQHAYLQVHSMNIPALHLYEKMGFREVYRYWYRIKPISGR